MDCIILTTYRDGTTKVTYHGRQTDEVRDLMRDFSGEAKSHAQYLLGVPHVEKHAPRTGPVPQSEPAPDAPAPDESPAAPAAPRGKRGKPSPEPGGSEE